MIGLLRRSFLAIHQDPSVYQNPNEYMGMAGQRRSLGENGSNPTMAVAATAAGDQQLQQAANVSEKEKERETSIASVKKFSSCMNLLLQPQQSDNPKCLGKIWKGVRGFGCSSVMSMRIIIVIYLPLMVVILYTMDLFASEELFVTSIYSLSPDLFTNLLL
ncbi:hypothetical protein LOK49_Contig100G00009 [Camellia lanceoleosa]|nr:hypothetical protein LOK49_Contig100G00009 [Camellia lanceoleosa]